MHGESSKNPVNTNPLGESPAEQITRLESALAKKQAEYNQVSGLLHSMERESVTGETLIDFFLSPEGQDTAETISVAVRSARVLRLDPETETQNEIYESRTGRYRLLLDNLPLTAYLPASEAISARQAMKAQINQFFPPAPPRMR